MVWFYGGEARIPVSDDMKMLIASNISYYRKLRNLSQTQLGTVLGVARNTISNLEHGDIPVTAYQLATICETLDVPVAAMFEPPESDHTQEALIIHRYREDIEFRTAVNLLMKTRQSEE